MSHAASMYVRNLTAAPNGEKLTPAKKLLLVLLADWYSDEMGCAWPRIGALAENACITADHCAVLLRQLHNAHVLEIRPRRRENGACTSNEYRFRWFTPAPPMSPPPANGMPTVTEGRP